MLGSLQLTGFAVLKLLKNKPFSYGDIVSICVALRCTETTNTLKKYTCIMFEYMLHYIMFSYIIIIIFNY